MVANIVNAMFKLFKTNKKVTPKSPCFKVVNSFRTLQELALRTQVEKELRLSIHNLRFRGINNQK